VIVDRRLGKIQVENINHLLISVNECVYFLLNKIKFFVLNLKNKETENAIYDPNLKKNPLLINYTENSCFQIKNTGHTFQCDAFPNTNSSKFKFQLIKVYII
jgi:hypothetical protein